MAEASHDASGAEQGRIYGPGIHNQFFGSRPIPKIDEFPLCINSALMGMLWGNSETKYYPLLASQWRMEIPRASIELFSSMLVRTGFMASVQAGWVSASFCLKSKKMQWD